jgi:adenylosuccinate synthase
MVKAIVGGNWGDEGKGKMTDLLAEKADIVVRFQGGANAGHTIINNYGKFILHTLPSGVFRENVTNVIAPGVALNLDSLFTELEMLEKRGVPKPNLKISERVQVVLPYHVQLDELEEDRLGQNSFGSTKSGIAPFYSDKYLKIGFQINEIFGDDLYKKIINICEIKNQYIQAVYHKKDFINPDAIYRYLTGFKEKVEPFICDTTYFLNEAEKNGKEILLEGQLGALRDPDNGIYPFVTSSSPLAGFGCSGAGIPPYAIKEVITVVKAYSSCVGAGAFVSEIFGEEAEELRKRGGDAGEYGATTGRPRRMGWFDIVATKYGCMLQGTTGIALTLVDVLGYLDKIPVCTAYEMDDSLTDVFPVSQKLVKAKPVYTYLDGWKSDIRGIRNYIELPEEAKKYIEFIEGKLGFPVTMISTGPERDDIIYRN